MPIPHEYRTAAQDFEAFLRDVMDACNFATRNPAYTTTEAVFHAFRRRLDFQEGLRFASALPPILRAMFVKDWNPQGAPLPFATREKLTDEVKALRRDHNFSPETAISDVAQALHKHVNRRDFQVMLATLPAAAQDFWRVE